MAISRSNFSQLTAPTMRVLSDDQIQAIHFAGMEILERTGMQIEYDGAKDILLSNGAYQDEKGMIHIPEWMVKKALTTAPSRIVMSNRDGKRCMFLEGYNSHYGCNPDMLDYIDPYTHERRPYTSADAKQMATVSDWCENIDFNLTACQSFDVPYEVADRVVNRQMMLYCRKPIGFSCTSPESLVDIIDMAAIISGSHENLERNPYIFHIGEPCSPLKHDRLIMEEVMICAKRMVPMVYYPMPNGCGTAPATGAGRLALAHAESLTGLVVSQLTRPGAPFVYGAIPAVMDLKSMRFSYLAPESYLECSAMADMGHWLGLPIWGTAGMVDSKAVDAQAGAEMAFACLMQGLSGANLIHDAAFMDEATLVCPESLILANEVIGIVKGILRGVPVNEDTLAVDVIDEIGPHANYMGHPHTFRHFKELWMPTTFDRTINRTGAKLPRYDEVLNEKAKDIIENYEVPALEKAKYDALMELEKKWLKG